MNKPKNLPASYKKLIIDNLGAISSEINIATGFLEEENSSALIEIRAIIQEAIRKVESSESIDQVDPKNLDTKVIARQVEDAADKAEPILSDVSSTLERTARLVAHEKDAQNGVLNAKTTIDDALRSIAQLRPILKQYAAITSILTNPGVNQTVSDIRDSLHKESKRAFSIAIGVAIFTSVLSAVISFWSVLHQPKSNVIATEIKLSDADIQSAISQGINTSLTTLRKDISTDYNLFKVDILNNIVGLLSQKQQSQQKVHQEQATSKIEKKQPPTKRISPSLWKITTDTEKYLCTIVDDAEDYREFRVLLASNTTLGSSFLGCESHYKYVYHGKVIREYTSTEDRKGENRFNAKRGNESSCFDSAFRIIRDMEEKGEFSCKVLPVK